MHAQSPLPVFKTLSCSAKLLIRNWLMFLRCAAIMAVLFLVSLVAVVYFVVLEKSELGGVELPFLKDMMLEICVAVAIAHFAIRWHRFVLIDERPKSIFRFGRLELMYAILIIVGKLTTYVSELPFSILDSQMAFYTGAGLVAFDLLILLPLFSIMAPAIAVDAFAIAPLFYWKLLKNNRLRFLAVLVLGAVAVGAFVFVMYLFGKLFNWDWIGQFFDPSALDPSNPDVIAILIISFPSTLMQAIGFTFATGYLVSLASLSFRHVAVTQNA